MYGLRDLEAFIAVVDHGSVNAGAAALYRTQPTVSRQLAGLERQIGARLFRRTPSGMRLTEAGERLEPMARDLVRRGRRAAEVMATVVSGQRGFVLSCPEMTSMLMIAPFVAAGGPISDVLPALPVDVYARLKRGADLAVNTSPPPPGLRGVRLGTIAITCQVPPGHRFAGRDRVELAEVVTQPFVIPGHGSSIWAAVQRDAGAAGLSLEMASITSNAPLAQARAAAGVGPALVLEPPQFGLVASPFVHEGRPLTATFYAAWERGHYADRELEQVAASLATFMRSLGHLGMTLDGGESGPAA